MISGPITQLWDHSRTKPKDTVSRYEYKCLKEDLIFDTIIIMLFLISTNPK
jgi:hypothetical protein